MNKAILMGRLARDPETRYTKDQLAVTRYTLAVNRKGKKDQGTDFIDCVAFGKAGEFAEKYFHKGQQIAVTGRLQVRDWEDKTGAKRRSTEVIIEEQYFAEAKAQQAPQKEPAFYPAEIEDCDLPF